MRLANGVSLPAVGLGVFQASPAATRNAVRNAIQAGYRHVDTARVYGNEEAVGAAIRESGLPRSEIFVTTKLWNTDHGEEKTLAAFEGSRRRLGVEQVDLFLIHWPVPGLRGGSWRAMERLLKDGRVRAIGVSNYLSRHLDELEGMATVLPQVNQIEVHPFHQQRATREWCRKRGVVVEAYSPLTRGQRLDHPVVVATAKRLGRSPAQVLLRWGLEAGMVVLPKSVSPARIQENFALFDFSLDEAARQSLDALEEGRATVGIPAVRPDGGGSSVPRTGFRIKAGPCCPRHRPLHRIDFSTGRNERPATAVAVDDDAAPNSAPPRPIAAHGGGPDGRWHPAGGTCRSGDRH